MDRSILDVLDKGYKVLEVDLGHFPLVGNLKLVVPGADITDPLLFPLEALEADDVVTLCLANREPEAWKICYGKKTLDREGNWNFEPMPSERSDGYLETNRFSSAVNAVTFYESWKLRIITDFIKEKNLSITVEQVYGTNAIIQT